MVYDQNGITQILNNQTKNGTDYFEGYPDASLRLFGMINYEWNYDILVENPVSK